MQRKVPHGDRNHDRVDDAFEQRLRAAAARDRLAVVVTGLGAAEARHAVGDFALRHRLPLVDGFSATMTAGQARALARRPGVRRVEAVTTVRATDDGTSRDFGATAAATDRPGLDGSGVGICVIDTGIDPAHEQIAPRTVTFKDFIGTRTTAYDDHGHGTHVASIAAGDGAGGTSAATFAGVAPAAGLWAAKVLSSSGSGSNDGVVAGVQWCAAQVGVRVLSMSLGDDAGGDGTDVVSLAVNNAVAGGDVAVVAAGNAGDGARTIAAPGTSTGAITVGAVAEHSNPLGTDRHDDGIWLAAFSSRGPTVDGRVKPDVTAPGVTVRAAQAGTTAGYVTYSGTSMATPYVAGAVALGLEAVPRATPATVRSALTATALDAGAPGTDNEWGAGLVDVRAFVDALAGAPAPRRTPFPAWSRVTGVVPNGGSVDVPIEVPAEALGQPLAATVAVDGTLTCTLFVLGTCWSEEFSPDLDVELRRPDGTIAATSECPLSGLTCGVGRQEVVAVRPAVAGTWVLRLFAFAGSPNNGKGGPFAVDVAQGPTGTSQPPPPPVNTVPVANAGPDLTVRANRKTGLGSFTLDGTRSTDADGDQLAYTWTDAAGATVGSGALLGLKRAVGTWTFVLRVDDGRGGTSSDTVVVTVRR
ncbi:S8 family serine peptidase [Nocardia sp. N13]|uniref:S8 family serine peptidase n=1 Tax=Nocardioides sp. N13(2025) TaxID=3453405 RepID=UPI003F77228A